MDQYNWLYSSLSQSVAAFVGFLTAGYCFISGILDKKVEDDETLIEIVEKIKTNSHKRMKLILWTAGIAIIISLLALYFQQFLLNKNWANLILVCIAISFGTASIITAILFVISILNPDKFKIVNNKLINHQDIVFEKPVPDATDALTLVQSFGKLEKLTREVLPDENKRRPINLLIKTLKNLEVIGEEDYKNFLMVASLRNLIVHGENPMITSADLQKYTTLIDELIEKINAKESK